MKDSPPLVVVVDDDESVREALPDLLRVLGFAASTFGSAEEFLAADCIANTNILILDVVMPGMSGPDLQHELIQRGHDLPVIFVTARSDEQVRTRVLQQGATACLYKPFSNAALLEALHAAQSKLGAISRRRTP